LVTVFKIDFPQDIVEELLSQLNEQYTKENTNLVFSFWKPDGYKIDEENQQEMNEWLRQHDVNQLIDTVILNTNEWANRRKIVEDLKLGQRINIIDKDTISNYEEWKINMIEERGVDVYEITRPDGSAAIKIIYPK
jgi:hypothetical protein